MPAWTTPLLCPVWCRPTSGSRSSTHSDRPGWRSSTSRATARPTMPPPTTRRSVRVGGASTRRDGSKKGLVPAVRTAARRGRVGYIQGPLRLGYATRPDAAGGKAERLAKRNRTDPRMTTDQPLDGLGHLTAGATAYAAAVQQALADLDVAAVGRLASHLHAARVRGATVFVAGNGGSAATASHWVNDLGKATRHWGGARTRVVSLSDNTPWLTAL